MDMNRQTQLISASNGSPLGRVGKVLSFPNGKFQALSIGGVKTLTFLLDGINSAHMIIRVASEPDFAVEVQHRQFKAGTKVCLWAPTENKEWSLAWHFNDDATLSPVDSRRRVQKHVVLGWQDHLLMRSLCLVDSGSDKKIVWCPTYALRTMTPRLPSDIEIILEISHRKSAITYSGDIFQVKQFKGRGQQLSIDKVQEATFFKIDGSLDDCALRATPNSNLALEVKNRSYEPGSTLLMWSNDEHPEWACRWYFNSLGNENNATSGPNRESFTLSPINKGVIIRKLVVGADSKKNDGKLKLVPAGRHVKQIHLPKLPTMVYVIENKDQIVFEALELSLERHRWLVKARMKEAQQRTTALRLHVQHIIAQPNFIKCLRDDGFCKISGLVHENLINDALQHINRQIGSAVNGNIERFRGKVFATDRAITNLFNKSGIPLVLEHLFQHESGVFKFRQNNGQIALRFPGDACIQDTCTSNKRHFKNIRNSWHIDGCASDFLPGVTTHYGTIKNFDCLVGVLLSHVNNPMSGELCLYPGSHNALANYWKKNDLERLKNVGAKLQPTGKTDELFKSKVSHGIGKPGDVFFANYMTAHFVAPNTSPNVRYAVYFRVKSPQFGNVAHNPRSMLEPWIHWAGVQNYQETRLEERNHGMEQNSP